MGQTTSEPVATNVRNERHFKNGQTPTTKRGTARSTNSQCEGYVLTEDIRTYADDLINKMDFINGDSTSTAEKINELKMLIEKRVEDNTNAVKGNNTYSMNALQEDLTSMKETLETKMQSIIDSSSTGNKMEVKTHVSEEIKILKDQLSSLIGNLESYDNALANNETLKKDVDSSLSALKADLLSAFPTNDSTDGESLKSDMDSKLTSFKAEIISALLTKESGESLKSHFTSELSSTKDEILSIVQKADAASTESDNLKKHVQTTSDALFKLIQTLDLENSIDVKEHVTKQIETMTTKLSSAIENVGKGNKGSTDPTKDLEYLRLEADETQRNVKSVYNILDAEKREAMDDVLGLTKRISQSIKSDAILQYLEVDLCEKNTFFTLSGAYCEDLDKQYEKISNTVPACKEYYQSKKDALADPSLAKPMSAACEYSLANIASSCLSNDVCEKCGSDGSTSCRTNCWYINSWGQSKFEIRPHCESMLNNVTESYKDRQYIYSLNRITECDSNLCKQYEISNNIRYKPDACNLTLDSEGKLGNMTQDCLKYLESAYSMYEQGCNESFEEQYNTPSVCTNNKKTILQSV